MLSFEFEAYFLLIGWCRRHELSDRVEERDDRLIVGSDLSLELLDLLCQALVRGDEPLGKNNLLLFAPKTSRLFLRVERGGGAGPIRA